MTGPAVPDDPLLAEAGDFGATIRDAQDELIRTTPESVLMILGGPGTGKTDTALRRVAWLLDDPEFGVAAGEVLVVGPSPAFARRTRALLDGWGHEGVAHSSVDELLPKAVTGRSEAPHVTRLKGEARLAGLLSRAIEKRRQRLAHLPSAITVRGRVVRLDPATITRVIATAKASEATPGDRRRLLRAALVAGTQDPRLILEAADQLADRLWPEFEATTFLAELFASRALLMEAAEGEFTDREIDALHRVTAEEPPFGEADLPLLDEAEHLSGLEPHTYAHVVVDEAQDLSPMQLRAISRRSSNGSLTVVGDMAQSTGPWARDDWHDVLAHLPSTMPHVHRELRFGYRVPRQIFDLAAELLPTAAPSVQPPTTVREGPADPLIAPVDPATRAAVVVAAAADHAADGRSVAIICPARCRDEIEEALRSEELPWGTAPGDARGPAITLLSPHEAKGLEFDATIVVEPGFIVDDDPRGHRLLYTALTRATSHLHLVGAPEDLPATHRTPEHPSGTQHAGAPEGVPATNLPGTPDDRPATHHADAPEDLPTTTLLGTPDDGSGTHPAGARDNPADAHFPGAHLGSAPGNPPATHVGDATDDPPGTHRTGAPESVPATRLPGAPEPEALAPQSAVEPPPVHVPVPLDPAVQEQINMVAHALAETMLANLTPELWPVALDRLIELISPAE